MAAVLACGEGAALSHRSAAAHRGLRPSDRRLVDVTSPRRVGRTPGIDAHRSRSLRPTDVTKHEGIPCTTVARTLLDLADVVDRRGLERAIDRAEALRLLDMRALEEALSRANGRRGAATLATVLAEHQAGSTLTRSELEERFLALCRTSGVAQPKVNLEIVLPDCHVEADFAWPEHRLIAETDGHQTHGTRRAFERDRRRDQRLAREGWRVVRFTWRQLTDNPDEVATTLKALLTSP